MIDWLYKYRARVRSVYDGDTIRLDIDLGLKVWIYNEPVRLYGINAPELRGSQKEQGILARDYLKEQIDGRDVFIQTLRDRRGKYGRWLACISLDGIDINRKMVESGHAVWANY